MHDIQKRMDGTENKLCFSHVWNTYLNTYSLIYIKISTHIWNTHSTHMKSKGDFENWGRDIKEQGLGKKRFHTCKFHEIMSLLEPLVGSWVRIYFKRLGDMEQDHLWKAHPSMNDGSGKLYQCLSLINMKAAPQETPQQLFTCFNTLGISLTCKFFNFPSFWTS